MKTFTVYVNDGLSGYLAAETLEAAEREADRLWKGNPVVNKIELVEMLPTPHKHTCEQCGADYMAECSDVACELVVDGFCGDDCAIETTPRVAIGYDYTNQAWIENDRYVRCGHRETCQCYGRLNAGQVARPEVLERIAEQYQVEMV